MIVKVTLSGIEYIVGGYVEAADRSVGIMGDYFIADALRRVDNGEPLSDEGWDKLTDEDHQAIDKAYWAAYDEEHRNDPIDDHEDPNDDWYDVSEELK